MRDLTLRFCVLAVGALLTSAATAADIEITQKDKKFNRTSVTLKVGDSIDFKNEDPFVHNIFSLSDAKTFDLGSYPQGQSKKVTFDKPGSIDVECAIHPDMKLSVEVKK